MQIHQLKQFHKSKQRKRVGRGGKRGTYSGRGIKGQGQRAGANFVPPIRHVIKRYPKLRGYRQRHRARNLKMSRAVLNLAVLEEKFNAGEKITPQALLDKRIIRKIKGMTPQVKILAKGEIKKCLVLENCLISKQAQKKMAKICGSKK